MAFFNEFHYVVFVCSVCPTVESTSEQWKAPRNSGKYLGTVENYSDSLHISGVIIGLYKCLQLRNRCHLCTS